MPIESSLSDETHRLLIGEKSAAGCDCHWGTPEEAFSRGSGRGLERVKGVKGERRGM